MHNTPMPPHLGQKFPVLIVTGTNDTDSPLANRARELVDDITLSGLTVDLVHSDAEGAAYIAATPQISCAILGLDHETDNLNQLETLVHAIRRHGRNLPVFVATSRMAIGRLPVALLKETEGYIWLFEDSSAFIAGRIVAAAHRYLDTVLPPFFGALANFAKVHEYSWHTPGHTGGTAFRKTAVGSAFLNFYGEEMLRSDLSVSVGELGSLNDHSGALKEAEQFAAKTFGADFTVFSVGGSSASNQMVLHAFVTDGDVVLVDRNCHKSLNYALNMTGAVPVYLMPRRNHRGVIGPVPREEMTAEAIAAKIKANPLVKKGREKPVLAVLTNSTYDGLCYDITTTTQLLGQSVDRIHYDEAWYGYARFNPVYSGRFGMHDEPHETSDPTVTATQSTHKLLAALSQASMVHVRQGRKPIDFALFNEAFMMHTSTSPQYSIMASTDISTKMMHDAGPALTDECIREAIDFRQEIGRIGEEILGKNSHDWWFETWQPQHAGTASFVDANPDMLATDPKLWALNADDDTWHGFGDLGVGYCMLDPIKVTLLTPGINADGSLAENGIPASIVSAFLDARGIVVEKTEPYSILVLFSIGITKGKWGSLVSALLEFKDAYDSNAPLGDVIPSLTTTYPERYQGIGLKEFASEMHAFLAETALLDHLDAAFMELPVAAMTPRDAYNQMVRGDVERLPVSKIMDRVLAVQIVPYPPGIPVLMPGEKITRSSKSILDYLSAMEKFDARFPGFEHETHGVETERDADGRPVYHTYVLNKSGA
ncbi:Orn/Lys/Arg decarboxylase N-terminal domain-containing protein [Thalassospira sp. MCCC 1A01428]|uniref:Orn/Lys/Arg family decarboxylase n=1 Tax=Thalassospira sp. MCCC 1A01428 TaxID=1470575 RepID=UPI000A1FBF24|nr:Orn/Lys/Arg decarboxylase N-terminal domain-containing protein [Thalassospira sp. MCCC 1A01428]OSQ36821.1 arginine decarboxylase [Thalassospira sp. MCCC 1A01428]